MQTMLSVSLQNLSVYSQVEAISTTIKFVACIFTEDFPKYPNNQVIESIVWVFKNSKRFFPVKVWK